MTAFLPSTVSDQLARQHEALAAAFDEGVGHVGVHRRGDVRDERPRRRGPDRQRHGHARPAGELLGAGRLQREAHVDRVLGDLLVALRHLVTGDRRAAARAVGHDLEALVEEALVPDAAQDPPDRLDVVVGERVVGVVEVDPEADALGHAVPLAQVRQHALAAQLVELGDAVGLDLLLAVDPQAPFDLELHREAVAVPAGLAGDAVAAHRLVAREDVLEDAREDVMGAGLAVRRRRAFVEDPERRIRSRRRQALVEDVVVAPEGEDPRVHRREVGARRDLAEPGLPVAHVTNLLLVRDRGTAGRRSPGPAAGRHAIVPETLV